MSDSPETSSFAVWRQDDNGIESLVKGFLTRTQATDLAAEYEARGHKQLYSVRPDTKGQRGETTKRTSDNNGGVS